MDELIERLCIEYNNTYPDRAAVQVSRDSNFQLKDTEDGEFFGINLIEILVIDGTFELEPYVFNTRKYQNLEIWVFSWRREWPGARELVNRAADEGLDYYSYRGIMNDSSNLESLGLSGN